MELAGQWDAASHPDQPELDHGERELRACVVLVAVGPVAHVLRHGRAGRARTEQAKQPVGCK